MYRVYKRKAEKRLQQTNNNSECGWVPQTPVKVTGLIDLNKSFEAEAQPGKRTGLIDLNKSFEEPETEAEDVPQVSEFSVSVELNKGIGVELNVANLSPVLDSREETKTESKNFLLAAESYVSQSFTCPDSKIYGNIEELANSDLLPHENDANKVKNQQNETNCPESCVLLPPQQKEEEEVSGTEVENLKKRLKRGPKQKPKRKKIRPRVLVEGKPNKTPQPKTPKPKKTPQSKTPQGKTPKPETPGCSNETTRKRKSARKNLEENFVSGDVVDESVCKKRKCTKLNRKSNLDATIERPPPPKTCRQALNFDLESRDDKVIKIVVPECGIQEDECATPECRVQLDECNITKAIPELAVQVDDCVDARKQSENNKTRRTRSRRIRRLNTLFMFDRPELQLQYPRRRLRRAAGRCNINLLTAIPICSQLPKLLSKQGAPSENAIPICSELPMFPSKQGSPGDNAIPICSQLPKLPSIQAAFSEKEEGEIIYEPKASKNILLTNNIEKNVADVAGGAEIIPGVVDDKKNEGSPLKYEDFPFIRYFTGIDSQDSNIRKHPLQLENFGLIDQTIGLQKVLEKPAVGLQEGLPEHKVFSQEERLAAPPLLEHRIDSRTLFPGQSSGIPAPFSGQSIGATELSAQQKIGVLRLFPEQTTGAVEPILDQSNNARNHHPTQKRPPRRSRGSQEGMDQQLMQATTAAIIRKFETLTIRDGGSRLMQQYNKAYGPSSGHGAVDPCQVGPSSEDRAVVPYRVKEKRKKPVPVPEVDLDPKSLRMWNLTMSIDDGTTKDQTRDEEMEKWWEKEREIFGGRIQSFSARMRLILGDRRFKPWKGSVVDSVIGVYLTQNVADNLSSSAYMSLASRFPLKSTSNHTASNSTSNGAADSEGNTYFVTHPEPDSELKGRINPFDSRISGISEIENMRFMNQLSPTRKADVNVAPSNKTGNVESSKLCPIENSNCLESSRNDLNSKSEMNKGRADVDVASSNKTGNVESSKLFPTENSNCLESFRNDLNSKSETKNEKTKKNITKKKNDNQKQQDWDLLRRMYSTGAERSSDQMDSVDWEAVRCAEERDIADAIKGRGQHNIIAGRIKGFLNRLVQQHGSIDLEWLRNVPSDKVKEYLLDIEGLGLKSVECIRLLSLQHIAFPVDVNVGRIAVRLGWVPLQPLPGGLHIHLLEEYPVMDTIQKYLWPRLSGFDQKTLYELHYQLITFGKVFCKKKNPNCGACPLRGECKHFASAFASARFALPGPSEKGIVTSEFSNEIGGNPPLVVNPIPIEANAISEPGGQIDNRAPIIELPQSPGPQCEESPESNIVDDYSLGDIEDFPTIRLQEREFKENVQNFIDINKIVVQHSSALSLLTAEAASMPAMKLKNYGRLRTDHTVYVLPDQHQLLQGFERRDPDDSFPYLLAIWLPGETANSVAPSQYSCNSEESKFCNVEMCYSCNSSRETNAGIVRGTILIPCRTANRGRFPLNGTYFQVNEVFADHETSYHPINVPRHLIAELPRQKVCFGNSASSIFHALTLREIQQCFWFGCICTRGFDRKFRCPKPLATRLHCRPSKMETGSKRTRNEKHE